MSNLKTWNYFPKNMDYIPIGIEKSSPRCYNSIRKINREEQQMDIWTWKRILRSRINEKPLFPLVLRYGDNNSVEPHTHDFLELVYVPSGTADHYYHFPDGEILRRELYPGDFFAVPPGMCHSFANGNRFCVINICLDPALITADFRDIPDLSGLKILFRQKPGMLHVNPDRKEEFEHCLNQIIRELHDQQKRWREAVSGLFRYLLILVGRLPEKGSPEAMEYTLPVRKAIDFLQKHLSEKITLRDVAIAAGIGKSSLCRKFRKEVGKTPWELLNSIRIRKAVFYLGTRDRPSISETAYLCGFEDSGYFSRIFRRETGISPSRCRDGFKI